MLDLQHQAPGSPSNFSSRLSRARIAVPGRVFPTIRTVPDLTNLFPVEHPLQTFKRSFPGKAIPLKIAFHFDPSEKGR
jgi:hypothetical protein